MNNTISSFFHDHFGLYACRKIEEKTVFRSVIVKDIVISLFSTSKYWFVIKWLPTDFRSSSSHCWNLMINSIALFSFCHPLLRLSFNLILWCYTKRNT